MFDSSSNADYQVTNKTFEEEYPTLRREFLKSQERKTFIKDNLTLIQCKLHGAIAYLKNKRLLKLTVSSIKQL
jgi:hypothetical protein